MCSKNIFTQCPSHRTPQWQRVGLLKIWVETLPGSIVDSSRVNVNSSLLMIEISSYACATLTQHLLIRSVTEIISRTTFYSLLCTDCLALLFSTFVTVLNGMEGGSAKFLENNLYHLLSKSIHLDIQMYF